MTELKWRLGLVPVTLTAFLTLTALRIPAAFASSAEAPRDECTAEGTLFICLYEHPNFLGKSVASAGVLDDLRHLPSDQGSFDNNFDNKTSSIRNNTKRTWCFYEHPYHGGKYIKVGPGGSLKTLVKVTDNTNVVGNWDNRISSLYASPSPWCK